LLCRELGEAPTLPHDAAQQPCAITPIARVTRSAMAWMTRLSSIASMNGELVSHRLLN
jgi:hypothetical protein